LQRESELENSLAPFRVGSVRYLKCGTIDPRPGGASFHLRFLSELAEMLRRDELDAALVSVTEV